jgi:hypothetical protein
MSRLIRVFEGVAHVVGPLMMTKRDAVEPKQAGWYPCCMTYLLPNALIPKVDIDAPVAEVITCLACSAKER